MSKLDRMGVFVLVAHLIITIAILGVYTSFAMLGKDVTNIEMILTVIVGYWFGAMGTNAIRPSNQTQIQSANEVKVTNPTGNQQKEVG